ncbi:MAG: hypothetical protein ACHQQR_02055 [Gemmatimonadales bacterium]|jgi:hypothetical protein
MRCRSSSHLWLAAILLAGCSKVGIDVMIVGTSPSGQPTATGTACGRSGVVPLP